MRVLVTGAAGFIGSHVLDALLTQGHEVRALDSLSPAVHWGRPSYVPEEVDLRVADVRDPAAVESALEGVDAVCHLAAMVGLGVSVADLPLYADVNVTGTAVLLAAMARAGVARLVLSSSMVVYGEGLYGCSSEGCVLASVLRPADAPRPGGMLRPADALRPVRPLARAVADLEAGAFDPRCPACGARLSWMTVPEDATLDPRNAYATSKLAQEHLAANWARVTGGAVVALRYHNVYGPRMPRDTPYSGVAAIFRSALENGQPPRVFEDGGQLRDFVHVRDVAESNVLALAATDVAAGLTADVAADVAAGLTVGLTVDLAVDLAGGSPSGAPVAVPAGTLRAYNVASGTPHTVGEMAAELAAAFGGRIEPKVTGEYRLGDVRHIVASPEAAARDLGFRAGIGFSEGIAEFARAELRAPAAAR
jgi:dTDP-L-rhamnose 4-epimerase